MWYWYTICLLLVGLMTASATAANEAADVSQLYEWARQARHSESYRGVLNYTQDGVTVAYRVSHRSLGKAGMQEYLHSLDGAPYEIYWNGTDLLCRVPGDRVMRLRSVTGLIPFDEEAPFSNLSTHYELALAGEERLAGRPVRKYMLMARDDWRNGYLWWLDSDTRILLKSVTLSREGRRLDEMEFVSIEYASADEVWTFPDWAPDMQLDKSRPADAPVARWMLNWLPPGFMPLDAAATAESTKFQVRYTDGLASFSLYIESGSSIMPEGQSQKGATVALTHHVRSGDGAVTAVTVVGEIPLEAARKLADNLVVIHR